MSEERIVQVPESTNVHSLNLGDEINVNGCRFFLTELYLKYDAPPRVMFKAAEEFVSEAVTAEALYQTAMDTFKSYDETLAKITMPDETPGPFDLRRYPWGAWSAGGQKEPGDDGPGDVHYALNFSRRTACGLDTTLIDEVFTVIDPNAVDKVTCTQCRNNLAEMGKLYV